MCYCPTFPSQSASFTVLADWRKQVWFNRKLIWPAFKLYGSSIISDKEFCWRIVRILKSYGKKSVPYNVSLRTVVVDFERRWIRLSKVCPWNTPSFYDNYIFTEIENFLSDDECEHFIRVAEESGMEESKTYSYRVDNRKQIIIRDTNRDKRLSLDEVIH